MAGRRFSLTPEQRAQLAAIDTSAAEALTDTEIAAAVASDPDAAPLTTDEHVFAARVRQLRQQQGLSQPRFAEEFGIPVGTLRDWEQARVRPDQVARTLIRVIERNPDAVHQAVAEPL